MSKRRRKRAQAAPAATAPEPSPTEPSVCPPGVLQTRRRWDRYWELDRAFRSKGKDE